MTNSERGGSSANVPLSTVKSLNSFHYSHSSSRSFMKKGYLNGREPGMEVKSSHHLLYSQNNTDILVHLYVGVPSIQYYDTLTFSYS